MTWFKVDDKLAFHPKVIAAGNPAMGLWVRAGAWASDQLTDGFIPTAMVELLASRRPGSVQKLVTSGLWIPDKRGGFVFHDWTDINPKSDDVKQGRDAMSRGSTFANHQRWHAQRGTYDDNCPHCRRWTNGQVPDRVPDRVPDTRPDS